MVNNSYACGNSKLLNGILKDELGFQGWVVSDWLAARSGVASALAGLDVTMPGEGLGWHSGNALWGDQMTKAVLNGSLPISRLNDMVARVVATWYKFGQDTWPSPPPEGRGGPNFSSWSDSEIDLLHPGTDDKTKTVVNRFVDVRGEGENSHANLTRRIAAEGTVLVKNEDGVLPLSRHGWPGESQNNGRKLKVGIFGEDAGKGNASKGCPDSGCNWGTLATGWGSGSVESDHLISPSAALTAAVDPARVEISCFPTNDPPLETEPSMVRDQDICLVFINSNGGEGYIAVEGIRGDRNDLRAQHEGEELVRNVAKECGNGSGKTVVIIHSIGPVIVEDFVDAQGVKALVLANLPGQESGDALVDILFGDINPSGKLPYTIGRSLDDYGAGSQVLYYPNAAVPQQGISGRIDYQDFDSSGVDPRYPFGYGLSYTTFQFSQLSVKLVKAKSPLPAKRPSEPSPPRYDEVIPPASEALFPPGLRRLSKYIYPYIETEEVGKGRYPYPEGYGTEQPRSEAGGGEGGNPSLFDVHAEVSVQLTNSGARMGKEVVQLYVSSRNTSSPLEENVEYPIKVLRAFEKVELEPAESRTVKMELTRRDLSYWSVLHQTWVMPTEGRFQIQVGSSSKDLPLVAEL
ncbi:MAG: hypothetical protein M1833_006338 [Piccolia ochrophora]|nr:MAG: hypothetical protein M1833_006338 [Piccolia ochrophora]